MSNPNNTVSRYSEEDLAMFKEKVEAKLVEAKDYLNSINEQIENINETLSGDGDWMDDTGSLADLEMLQIMLRRQQNHIVDLENALLRIHNKSYGICAVTGELIEKKRLLAVPTTTKSVAAKVLTPPTGSAAKRAAAAVANDDDDDETEKKAPPVKERKEPVIITKVIRKVNPNAPAPDKRKADDDDDDLGFDDDFLDIDDNDDDDDDFDNDNKISYVDPDSLEDRADDSEY